MGRITAPPFDRDMTGLPRLARQAFAARCARRALAVIDHAWPDGSRADRAVLERAVGAAEEAGAGTQAPSLFREVERVLENCDHPPARGAIMAIEDAAAGPAAAASAASWTCGLVPYTLPPMQRFAASDGLHDLVWGDLERLLGGARADAWTDAAAVAPEFFGPLWPDGEPRWFPLTAPGLPTWGEDRPELPAAKLDKPGVGLPPRVLKAFGALRPRFKIRFRPAPSRTVFEEVFGRAERSPALEEFRSFFSAHDGAVLSPKSRDLKAGLGERIHLFPLAFMEAETQDLIGWDCTRIWLDARVRDEQDEYARTISKSMKSSDPPSPMAPYRREDMVVFARAQESADCFFTVLRGPLAGKVLFFDHETACGMDRPVAAGLIEFLERLPRWSENSDELLM